MTPLIDADILLHELGWSGQFKDKETGEELTLPFETVQELLDEKIRLICEDSGGTEPPILFLSNTETIVEIYNKWAKYSGATPAEFCPNFRYEVAVTKPYKGTRKNPKPFHFYNIAAYLISTYDVRVSKGGLEADDEMCIMQFGRDDTIICSRDKDLRICPGHHYSWECGKQAAIGPVFTDRIGGFNLEGGKEGVGYGLAFFYLQMLTGDSADNIPGLPGHGIVRAKKLLEGCVTEQDYYQRVKKAYKEVLGDQAKEYFFEQANLLHMIMERGKSYEPPKD